MKSQEEATRELARRELARRHFKHYVSYIFESIYGKPYIFGKWHEQFFEALEEVRRGELKRLMIFLPPRSGKSEIISKLFPSFLLGEDPAKNVIISSYGAELANDFGRKTRQVCDSVPYKNIFNKFRFSKDKKEGGNWETSRGGGLYSVGVQGALTGKGFDCGIIDDPVKDRQDAESPLIRERVWDWYTSTFYTRKQSEDASIIVLQTRWNTDDLSGRLLERMAKEEGDYWKVICYPALNEKEESFFPERFSSEYYKNERRNIGKRDFEALYQQDPIASMGQVFSADKWRYFAMSDFEKVDGLKKTDFEVGVFVDPAFSTREQSDDAVIMAVARHKQTNELYILEIQADTYLPSVATKMVINMARKYKMQGWTVRLVSVEDVSLNRDQSIFCDTVDEEMRVNGEIFTLNRYKPKGKKEDRIKYSLEPYFDRNAIFFRADDTGNSSWRKMEDQFLKFPATPHDDIIDCLTQAVEVFDIYGRPAKDERYEGYTSKLLFQEAYNSETCSAY